MSCPDCFKGAVHEGKPTGTVTKLHGLDTYVAEPASGRPAKSIIVIVPDAFGWDFVNIRLIADHYAAKKDYRVYAPDFMNGNSASLSLLESMKIVLAPAATWAVTFSKPYHVFNVLFQFATWGIPNRFGKTAPVVQAFMTALRRNEGAHLPVGAAGFCWGGKHVVTLGSSETPKADGKPLIDAGFTAHPSWLSLYDDIHKLTTPTSFAIGDKDNQVSAAQAVEIGRIVEAKPEKQRGEMRLYPGYGHGFGCRIDAHNDDPKAGEDAEDQAVAWFERHFEGVKY